MSSSLNPPNPHGDLNLQDPPPYGQHPCVLVVSTGELQALAEQPREPATASPLPRRLCAHFVGASLQLTPLAEHSSPGRPPGGSFVAPASASTCSLPSSPPRRNPAHRPRSHTFEGTRRTRARDRLPSVSTMSAPSSSPPPYSLTPPDIPRASPRPCPRAPRRRPISASLGAPRSHHTQKSISPGVLGVHTRAADVG